MPKTLDWITLKYSKKNAVGTTLIADQPFEPIIDLTPEPEALSRLYYRKQANESCSPVWVAVNDIY